MRRKGLVQATLIADGSSFETRRVAALDLDHEGISGDRHRGPLRKAGGREPWYARGTPIRNMRALSLVSEEDLSAIAQALDIPALAPEWIGANLLVRGLPHFSFLPAGTHLFFEGGAVLVATGLNKPCRVAGAAIERHVADGRDLALAFPQKAQGLRGIVAVVERPGVIAAGSGFEARIPDQWIYPG